MDFDTIIDEILDEGAGAPTLQSATKQNQKMVSQRRAADTAGATERTGTGYEVAYTPDKKGLIIGLPAETPQAGRAITITSEQLQNNFQNLVPFLMKQFSLEKATAVNLANVLGQNAKTGIFTGYDANQDIQANLQIGSQPGQ